MLKYNQKTASSTMRSTTPLDVKTSEQVMSASAVLQRTLPALRRNEMYQNYTAVLCQNKNALDKQPSARRRCAKLSRKPHAHTFSTLKGCNIKVQQIFFIASYFTFI